MSSSEPPEKKKFEEDHTQFVGSANFEKAKRDASDLSELGHTEHNAEINKLQADIKKLQESDAIAATNQSSFSSVGPKSKTLFDQAKAVSGGLSCPGPGLGLCVRSSSHACMTLEQSANGRLVFVFCLVLSCLVFLSCLVLSCLVLSCLVLSCLVLSCLVLSCLVLSCLVLSCLVLSCLR
jgi:hypothetical protein